jgi:hypothetical protein
MQVMTMAETNRPAIDSRTASGEQPVGELVQRAS